MGNGNGRSRDSELSLGDTFKKYELALVNVEEDSCVKCNQVGKNVNVLSTIGRTNTEECVM